MFLQQAPAETTGYMILGFAVIFGVIAIHLISLYARAGRLKKDIQMLEDILEE